MWQFWSFVVTDGLIREERGFGETVEQIIKTQVLWMEIWGASLLNEEQIQLKIMSLHDGLHMILSLYSCWKPFWYFFLTTVSEDYPGFWKIKSCCSCSPLTSFPEGWEEPWRWMLFQGCGQLLGQQLSTSSRIMLFGKVISCSSGCKQSTFLTEVSF